MKPLQGNLDFFLSEYLDYFDADYNYIGKAERNEIYNKGLWYHTFDCLIVNNGKLIIQLRSKFKKRSPNLLDISAGGHIQAGESVIDGGIREIKEELGLNVIESDLKYLGYYKIASDKNKVSRQFCHTYIMNNKVSVSDYKLQCEEVGGIFELDIEEGRKLFLNKVEEIEICGYLINEKNIFLPETRKVKINDFKQRTPNYWLKVFNCVEDFIKGRECIYI